MAPILMASSFVSSMTSGRRVKERLTRSLSTSPFYEERQRFHRELPIRPKLCSSSAPQLRLRLMGLNPAPTEATFGCCVGRIGADRNGNAHLR
jgi:hypothetical protein